MKQLLSLLLALLVAAGLLVACGSIVPPLAEPGQPTLVFVYTEA